MLTADRSGIDARNLIDDIENLAMGISQLTGEASNLSSVYQSKASDEANLPTVSSALRDTNQVNIKV